MLKLYRFLDSRLQFKIIMPFAVLTIALAIIGTYLSTRLVSGSLDERFERQLSDATSVVADELAQREQFHLQEIRAIAFTEGINEAVATQNQQGLQTLLFPIVANDGVDRVDIVIQDGTHLLTLRRPPGATNVSDYALIENVNLETLPAVQKVLNGVVDDHGDKHVEIGQIDNDELLITAGPVQQNGEIVGAIIVSSHIRHLLRSLKQATFAEISFYNPAGQILHTTIPGVAPENAGGLALTDEEIKPLLALDGTTGLRRSVDIDNREYDILPGIFWAKGEPLGFYSVALQTTAIESQGQAARNQMAFIFVSALVLVFAIGYLTSNMITARVQHLMENAMAVADGDFTRRTEISAEDEIGSLARSLNEMTFSLSEYTSALKNKIDELTALYESSTAVTVKSGLNLDQVLAAVTSSVREVMQDADQVVVHLLDEDNKLLAPIASAPSSIEGFPSYIYEENSRIDNLLMTAKPQIIQLVEIEAFTTANGTSTAMPSSTSALVTPLVTGHETIGMLTLTLAANGTGSYHTHLNEDSERLLGTFANQAAIAIKNAQLFEATQEAYEELQQLDRLKTEFINIAAHELRTPLGAILGHASSVEKRAPPKLKKYISFIKISALRMRTMIDAMLTIQRLEAGTAFLKVSLVDINSVIDNVVADYRPMAELEGHTLDVFMAETLPQIEVDAEKIGLVFSNLIANAIKFTPEDGRIEVATQDYGNAILVTIRDNGVGITPKNQEQIFERFYQVSVEEMIGYGDLGVGAGHGGMGIGLTIVKHLVDLHHGEVWVESEPGQGSTFFVSLPKMIPVIQKTTTLIAEAQLQ